ncbi:MAG: hypothetical protein AAGK47_07960 [Bacteroidota bacterium]
MTQEERSPLDKVAKQLLKPLKVTPPTHNWQQIREAMHEDRTDVLFRQLKDTSTPPPARNWQQIQKRLPLYVVYRRPLQFISKITAVLLLVSGLSQWLQQPQYATTLPPQHLSLSDTTAAISPSTFGEAVDQVMHEQATAKQHPIFSPEQQRYSETSETEQLLAKILADEQEFPDSILDVQRLQNILKPVQPLPVISTVARIESLPLTRLNLQSNQSSDAELRISVPLIFVEEEQEAKRLIEWYERSHPGG